MSDGGATAGRVVRNIGIRAFGELVGKLMVLAFMVVLAREVGAAELGVFVFAVAWGELTVALLGPGLDGALLRRVAGERSLLQRMTGDVLTLKAMRAVPLLLASWAPLWALGYATDTRVVVVVMTLAFALDIMNYTFVCVFEAVERSDLAGLTLMLQRIVSSGLGIAALAAGYGVRTVAFAYLAASTVALVAAGAALARKVARPRIGSTPAGRKEASRAGRPFAVQEVLSGGLARLDVVIISLLATPGVVGVYGAAYRLLEASLVVSTAVMGAFVAMYTYLDPATEPPLPRVFARSVKLVIVLLTPIAVVMAAVPGDLLELIYGPGFGTGAGAVRALAPAVVLLGVVVLTTAFVLARRDPRLLTRCFAAALALNIVLNLALVPGLGATGAALAMLATEALLVVLTLWLAAPEVGRLKVKGIVGACVVAGAAMAVVLVAAPGPLIVTLLLASVCYFAVLILVEHRAASQDLALVLGMVRSRFGSGAP